MSDPDMLEVKPVPFVERFGKRAVYIACVLGLLGFIVLAVSIHGGGGKPAPAIEQTPQEQKQAPLLEPPSGGLAMPSPKPEPAPAQPAQPAQAPQQKALSQQYEAERQERERIRQYRAQMELQALQAPLSVGSPQARQGASARLASTDARDLGAATAIMPEQPQPSNYDPAERKDKEDFLAKRAAQNEWTLPHTREAGAYCEIKTGTIIPGMMVTGINSDLPGKLIGQVSQNVYDTATGSMLVIPQGSRLFGTYDSRVAIGQNRVLIAWNRIVFPDGTSVALDAMPGTDQAGYSGLEDEVNNHYLKIFGSAMVMSLISGSMSYGLDQFNKSQSTSTNTRPTLQDEMGTALASQLGQASLQLLQQNASIKPTLEVRPGFRFNVVVIKDVIFDRPYVAAR